jgi:hypothetical protein
MSYATKEKQAAANKAWREANRDSLIEKRKRYVESNREYIAAWQKAYRERNKEKRKADKRADYLANKDKWLARSKEYQRNNPEKMKRYYRTYYLRNPNKSSRSNDVRRTRIRNGALVTFQERRYLSVTDGCVNGAVIL